MHYYKFEIEYKYKIVIILINMNKINEKGQVQNMVPLTPNLQQYKLHGGRNRTKKKNTYPNIHSTMQQIHPSCMLQKLPTTPTNSSAISTKYTACQNHPDKKAMYFSRDNSKKQLCGICAVTDGGGDNKFIDDQSISLLYLEYQKTKSIEAFKKRVTILKQSILNREIQMEEVLHNQSSYFGECINLLNQQFTNIIQDIEQKHRQLNSSLAQSIIKRKQTIEGNFEIMTQVKQSIQRYIYDINKNYEDILDELSIEHFRDIMKQYNTKIQYYNENILKKISRDQQLKNSINLYLPMQEIRRVMDKANIQYLGGFDNYTSPKSSEKVINHVHHGQSITNNGKMSKNTISTHDRKSESKIATTQQRKRNNTNNIIHPIRGANKQNFYNDSTHNLQYNDHIGYSDTT